MKRTKFNLSKHTDGVFIRALLFEALAQLARRLKHITPLPEAEWRPLGED